MKKRSLNGAILMLVLTLIAVGFQNCGEKLDLSAQLEQASTSTGVSFATSAAPGNENQAYQLSVVVNNIEDYTVFWEKYGFSSDY